MDGLNVIKMGKIENSIKINDTFARLHRFQDFPKFSLEWAELQEF